ncbi:MAG: ABC-ATPase domain-containing protein [Lachnospiraceae bacterium]|nr:ABC-ATPase domain-containing protein [Lachnospiraceae bacterium]
MKSATELDRMLESIHRRSYPAYKDLRGEYQFPGYVLGIDHVQGDPFAAPSRVSVRVAKAQAGFAPEMYEKEFKRIALSDFLLRKFGAALNAYTFQAKGSGKSGLIGVSRCGQEVLARTACELSDGNLIVRMEIGFPANGRTINSPELRKILFDYLPEAVKKSLYYKNLRADEVRAVLDLAEDQQAVREALHERKMAAFVANGSVLPRQSGVSQKPMKNAVPFVSPASMEMELVLPHRGAVRGMGIPVGITLIVGGGYHGKSTLLAALEQGVYNHIAGDGRELVITENTAVKIRAEDGRAITHVNISPFISDLPNRKDTVDFSTEDASGSTSQAANVVEALRAGAQTLLIDEDTCATNFMVRDELMQEVVSPDSEPITPFILQARALYEKYGISVILVAGSSGAYFGIADRVLQMDNYKALDITQRVRECLEKRAGDSGAERPSGRVSVDVIFDRSAKRLVRVGHIDKKYDEIKIKQHGRDSFSIGKDTVELGDVEQLLDSEQTTALAYCLKALAEQLEGRPQDIEQLVERLWQQLKSRGLASLFSGSYVPVSMAWVRRQEIYACVNRYRGLQ